jgi:uncharacterized protein (DUF488 family)
LIARAKGGIIPLFVCGARMNPLFTIGHSSHSPEAFLHLLARHGVEAVADVRSQPFSRRFPSFSRPALEPALKAAGLAYVFLGRELGARREERACYVGEAVSFDLAAALPAFRSGLERLREGLLKYRVALLCVEKDPLDCHRSILVGRHAARFADVRHILADGTLEPHSALEERLLNRFGWDAGDLFLPAPERLAAAYVRRGAEIAWKGENGEHI